MKSKWTWQHEPASPVGPCYAVVNAETRQAIVRYAYCTEWQRNNAYNRARWEAEDMNASIKQ